MQTPFIYRAVLCSAALLFACSGAPGRLQDDRGSYSQATAICDCPPGFLCQMYAEDPGTFDCFPMPPPVIYVGAGQFCGLGPDDTGRTVEFRCRLDALCIDEVCVCTHFPGGPCGPITCPEGTFCTSDEYGTFSCAMFAGECAGT